MVIKNKTIVLVVIFVFITIDVMAMFRMGESQTRTPEQFQKSLEVLKTLREKKISPFDKELAPYISTPTKCNDNEFFVYSSNPISPIDKGMCFSVGIFDLSRTLKDMRLDLPDNKEVSIPYSNADIRKIHHIFTQYAEETDDKLKANRVKQIVNNYSFQELINIANCIDYLDCPSDMGRETLKTIKEKIRSDSRNVGSKEFQLLYPDLKSVVMDPVINWLKTLIIKNRAQARKKIFLKDNVFPYSLTDLLYHQHRLRGKRFECIAFHPNNSQIIVAHWNPDSSKNIIAYDLEGKEKWAIDGNPVLVLTISPDGKYIAYGDNRHNVYLLEIISKTKTLLAAKYEHIHALAFNHDSTKLAVGCWQKYPTNLIVWDISNLNEPKFSVLKGHKRYVCSVAFSPDGKTLASGGMDDDDTYNLKIWDLSQGNLIKELSPEQRRVDKVIFSPQGTEIISGGSGYLIMWDIRDINNPISKKLMVGHPRWDNSVALSADGKIMITGSYSKEGNGGLIWDMSDYSNITYQTIQGCNDSFDSLVLSKDGKKLIAGSTYQGTLVNDSTYLALYTLLTDEDDKTLKNILAYDPDQYELLYQLYLKEVVTKPQVFGKLPDENIKNLLAGLPQISQQKTQLSGSLSQSSRFLPNWVTNWWSNSKQMVLKMLPQHMQKILLDYHGSLK
jgi:WD40 repeat protein